MSETKARNSSIDLFRIIFSIMIIMAHTYFLKDICPAISFWTSRAIARISVPFFLCTTGYFYIRGLTNGKDTFKKQIISILKTYVFWTIIYYILRLFVKSFKTFALLWSAAISLSLRGRRILLCAPLLPTTLKRLRQTSSMPYSPLRSVDTVRVVSIPLRRH